jgi:hypothetical protein
MPGKMSCFIFLERWDIFRNYSQECFAGGGGVPVFCRQKDVLPHPLLIEIVLVAGLAATLGSVNISILDAFFNFGQVLPRHGIIYLFQAMTSFLQYVEHARAGARGGLLDDGFHGEVILG